MAQAVYPGIGVYESADGRRGLVALKNFEQGEELFLDEPLVKLVIRVTEAEVDAVMLLTEKIALEKPELLRLMTQQYRLRSTYHPKLKKSDRKALSKIARKSGLTPVSVRTIYDLVATYNTRYFFQTVSSTSRPKFYERIQIGLGIAYTNHSCDPNAQQIASTRGAAQESEVRNGLGALRNIAVGEEIAWSYFSFRDVIPSTSDGRRRLLREKFDFTCTCEKCLDDSDS